MGVAAVCLAIEASGGLPSQIVHLYYVPVVGAALTLSRRSALAVAIAAGLAVSPAIDVLHAALGQDAFFPDPSPFNLRPDGWLVRPLAFVAISLLGSTAVRHRLARAEAERRHAELDAELALLGRIDKMVLSGAGEDESVHEIARLVRDYTDSQVAALLLPADDGRHSFTGYVRVGSEARRMTLDVPAQDLARTVFADGTVATAANVFTDAAYVGLADLARRAGFVAAAAAPVVLDGAPLGALFLGRDRQGEWSADDVRRLRLLADQTAIALSNARHRQALQRFGHETALTLATAIEHRDGYTAEHCRRLADYAVRIAQALRLDPALVEAIRLGAALHDVGKVAIPDYVLKKPAALDADEYAVMQTHPDAGARICEANPFLAAAVPVIRHHHEHFDGSGYPAGLRGEHIPLGARVVAVADAFDAMTTDRVYRPALPFARALETLRQGAGTQWDPDVVATFLSLIERAEPARAA